MYEIAYDAVIETFELMPKPRRRDPQAVEEAIKRAVRAAIAGHWQKKPICLVQAVVCCDRMRAGVGGRMIGRLNHVAIAVGDIAKASKLYKDTLGAEVSGVVPQPDHGVNTVFITLPNTKIELLEPLGENSPIAKFLERNPDGGIHHICYEVDDILAARDKLKADGARVLGDGNPKIGAHGKPVLFLHPKDFCGTLVEIEQA